MKTKTFKDLIVWQKAHTMVLEIYKHTNSFPQEEKYGLVSQIRRSAVSVSTNIVEGYKRSSRKDYIHFLTISASSLEETKYLLLLSKDLHFLEDDVYRHLFSLSDEIGKLLFSVKKGLTQNAERLTLNA